MPIVAGDKSDYFCILSDISVSPLAFLSREPSAIRLSIQFLTRSPGARSGPHS
nr:MAG TPA: hypothetical protein [Bacteriophage sp.]